MARNGINLSAKAKRRLLPSFLYTSFFYDAVYDRDKKKSSQALLYCISVCAMSWKWGTMAAALMMVCREDQNHPLVVAGGGGGGDETIFYMAKVEMDKPTRPAFVN